MLMTKEIRRERKRVTKLYLEGNLHRFLRRHHRQAIYEGVYLDYVTKWEKQPILRVIVKQLKQKIRWPLEICNIINIMRTLYMYYDYEYDEEGAKVAWEIYRNFEDDIEAYNKAKYNRWISINGFGKWPRLGAKKAFKEQKARGFIHVNDFEDYDRKCCHIFSNVNKDYIYPLNFYHFTKKWDYNKRGHMEIYIAQRLYGVQGWTRIVIPKTSNTI